jgi:hypothetical protein
MYPEGYRLGARRKLSGSLLEVDILDVPDDLARDGRVPPDVEFISETAGADGAVHDILRTGPHLRWIGETAAAMLGLAAGTHLACAQAFTSPRFFDSVVLGWLASEARLVMADNPTLESVLPPLGTYERLVVVDLLYSLQTAARALKAAGATRDLLAVIPQATIATSHGKLLKQVFGEYPRQLLLLEEIGILGVRVMHRGERFELAPRHRAAAPARPRTAATRSSSSRPSRSSPARRSPLASPGAPSTPPPAGTTPATSATSAPRARSARYLAERTASSTSRAAAPRSTPSRPRCSSTAASPPPRPPSSTTSTATHSSTCATTRPARPPRRPRGVHGRQPPALHGPAHAHPPRRLRH